MGVINYNKSGKWRTVFVVPDKKEEGRRRRRWSVGLGRIMGAPWLLLGLLLVLAACN